MKIKDEFSGTLTLTENSTKELFRVLKEQDETFISDVLDGKYGFTLKSADGRSVKLTPADKLQGKWKFIGSGIEMMWECPFCRNRAFGFEQHLPNYCGNCGARMKGADGE